MLSVLKATCLPRPTIHHQYLLVKHFATKTKRMVIIGEKVTIGKSINRLFTFCRPQNWKIQNGN